MVVVVVGAFLHQQSLSTTTTKCICYSQYVGVSVYLHRLYSVFLVCGVVFTPWLIGCPSAAVFLLSARLRRICSFRCPLTVEKMLKRYVSFVTSRIRVQQVGVRSRPYVATYHSGRHLYYFARNLDSTNSTQQSIAPFHP